MPKTVVLIKRVPKGSPAPAGYTFIRTTRAGDVYHKKDEIPVDTSTGMDDLAALLGSMGIKEQAAQVVVPDGSSADTLVEQVQNADEESLVKALAELGIRGGRRKTRKSKKTRKN
jgi:hypothetical protein